MSLYDLPVKSWFLPILGNGRGQKRGPPKELGIKLFFMMLGGHIQCISEEISFIELCLTFSANIGWIIILPFQIIHVIYFLEDGFLKLINSSQQIQLNLIVVCLY